MGWEPTVDGHEKTKHIPFQHITRGANIEQAYMPSSSTENIGDIIIIIIN